MRRTTRRVAIKQLLGGTFGAAALLAGSRTAAAAFLMDDEISQGERDAMAKVATDFMQQYDVPGLSVCIAHDGRFVYEEAFGFANHGLRDKLTSNNLFRIASVTKPFTSATVFSLIETGQVHLSDKVFGDSGALGDKYGTRPHKTHVEDITIDHLLTHTCGGWDNGPGDPMFSNPAMTQAELISWTLDNQPLTNPPGTHWAYSNFGYCVLGRVIEEVTRQTYRDYVQNAVLTPCHIGDMRISGNTLVERAPNEVTYYGQNGETPYSMNVRRMDSHGGWLATPADLVRFAIQVDGFSNKCSLLQPSTIRTMTTPTPASASQNYARGWYVNSLGNWWHIGSLPGTATVMVRTSSGFCWAALTNTRRQPDTDIDTALDNMMWTMAKKVSAWQPALGT